MSCSVEIETRWRKAMAEMLKYNETNQPRARRSLDSHPSVGGGPTHVKPGKTVDTEDTNSSRRERLVDKMKVPEHPNENRHVDFRQEEADAIGHRPLGTRRTRRSSPVYIPRALSPDRWSAMNPDWRKKWHKSLVFPATGKNRATVDDGDITRLDEGEFLNDNLISFYVRYLQVKLESEKPELLKKIYFFNTFFFEKLRSTRGRINYDGVRTWTAKFDLLSYDYIVVPVNENAHWYLAIICNTPNALNGMPEDSEVEAEPQQESPKVASIERDLSDISIQDHEEIQKESAHVGAGASSQTIVQSSSPRSAKKRSSTGGAAAAAPHVDPRVPKIVTLDSLGSAHAATCKALKEYLVEEARDKKGAELAIVPNGMTAKRIPEQDNFCDCGVYILGYMAEFLKDPDETVRKLLQKESMEWDIRPSSLRNQVRELLFKLQDEQQERLQKEKEEKRLLAKHRKKNKAAEEIIPGVDKPGQESKPAQEKGAVRGETTAPDSVPAAARDDGAHSGKSSPATATKEEAGPGQARQTPLRGPKRDPKVDTSTPAEVFVSAPSSPSREAGLAPSPTIKLESSKKDLSADIRSRKGKSEPKFVQGIPDSSSDVEAIETSAKRQKHKDRRSTPATEDAQLPKDTVAASPSRSTRQKSKQPGSSSPAFVKPLRSSQSESPKQLRARYDGIDRSVDLT